MTLSRRFYEQLVDLREESVLILRSLLTPARLLYLLSAVLPRVRFNPSNVIGEIEGLIISTKKQFDLEVLEPGDFMKIPVWSDGTETSDL